MSVLRVQKRRSYPESNRGCRNVILSESEVLTATL